MAAHIRTQIRNAFVALVTNLATTQTRVFTDREHPLADADMPGMRVFTTNENLNDGLDNHSTDAAAPYLQRREIVLLCEVLAKASSALDDTLVQIQREVEVAIATNPTLGGLAKLHCRLQQASSAVGYNTEVAAGQVMLTFKVTAYTMSNAPDVAV